jgi:hypothetical protein
LRPASRPTPRERNAELSEARVQGKHATETRGRSSGEVHSPTHRAESAAAHVQGESRKPPRPCIAPDPLRDTPNDGKANVARPSHYAPARARRQAPSTSISSRGGGAVVPGFFPHARTYVRAGSVSSSSFDTRPAAWLLEHSFPERWGSAASSDSRPERYRGDPFAAVDELAARQARKPDGY